MNLQLDKSVSLGYKNSAQKIRVMSEFWAITNAFCPCCGNEHLEKMPNNLPVADILCRNCSEIFELKSTCHKIGKKIPDGAYHTMIERIESNNNPQLLIMQYSAQFLVTDLIFVPKFFFTSNVIEKRVPLSQNARRAGWTGCNILYQKIPDQGKINIICNGTESKIEEVLHRYEEVKKLQTDNLNLRGWLLDILNCINDIKSEVFTLQDIYKYADFLKLKHGSNSNIEAKIRQQLQFLRDKGLLEFVKRGVYRKLSWYFQRNNSFKCCLCRRNYR